MRVTLRNEGSIKYHIVDRYGLDGWVWGEIDGYKAGKTLYSPPTPYI